MSTNSPFCLVIEIHWTTKFPLMLCHDQTLAWKRGTSICPLLCVISTISTSRSPTLHTHSQHMPNQLGGSPRFALEMYMHEGTQQHDEWCFLRAGHPRVSSYFSAMCSIKQNKQTKKWKLWQCPLNEHSRSRVSWYIFPRQGPSHDISGKVKALVEEEVSISLTPLLPQIPTETKLGPVRQAAEVCCRMLLLGWPVQQPDFNQGRGQREGKRGERSYVLSTPWMAWRTDGHRNAVRSASIVGGRGGLP